MDTFSNRIHPSIIAIYYLKIPLALRYQIPLNQSSALNVSIGADTRFLLWGDDNFQEILYEHINLGNPRKYKQIIVSPRVALGYSMKFKSEKKIRIEGNVGYDLQRAMHLSGLNGGIGFYSNLSKASYSNYGLSLKYFFSKH